MGGPRALLLGRSCLESSHVQADPARGPVIPAPQRPESSVPSGPHEGWTSWALSHVSGGGGPPCSGSQFPSLVSGQGRALARPRPLGRVWTQMAAPAKGSRALPGCWPETLQEGTGPGLRPGKATRGSCVTVGASGYSPHPRCGPSGQAPRALGVPGSGQCWGGGRGTATCWPGRELVTQARPFPPGMKSPGCSCESTDRQMGAVWPEPHRPIHLLPSAGRNRRTQLYLQGQAMASCRQQEME